MTLAQVLGSGFLLILAAFSSLAMAMHKHYRQIWQVEPTVLASRLLRISGISLLAAVWWLEAQYWHVAVGTVIWLALLSVGAIVWVCLLAWRPRTTGWLSLASLLTACIWLVV